MSPLKIECCKHCTPPERYPGCHATCKKYKEERAQLDEGKKKAKENETPRITVYDFNEIEYIRCKRHKRRPRE